MLCVYQHTLEALSANQENLRKQANTNACNTYCLSLMSHHLVAGCEKSICPTNSIRNRRLICVQPVMSKESKPVHCSAISVIPRPVTAGQPPKLRYSNWCA